MTATSVGGEVRTAELTEELLESVGLYYPARSERLKLAELINEIEWVESQHRRGQLTDDELEGCKSKLLSLAGRIAQLYGVRHQQSYTKDQVYTACEELLQILRR